MNPQQAVDRAHSAMGHGCIYRLGAGGAHPLRAVPWDELQGCDCSGFVAWCLGLPRHDEEKNVWYDTSRIAIEANGDAQGRFLGAIWPDLQLADLLVYGDHRDGEGVIRQGHVGIVTALAPTLVVHCSHRNWTEHSDAIRETGSGLWLANQRAVVARYAAMERSPAVGPA